METERVKATRFQAEKKKTPTWLQENIANKRREREICERASMCVR